MISKKVFSVLTLIALATGHVWSQEKYKAPNLKLNKKMEHPKNVKTAELDQTDSYTIHETAENSGERRPSSDKDQQDLRVERAATTEEKMQAIEEVRQEKLRLNNKVKPWLYVPNKRDP